MEDVDNVKVIYKIPHFLSKNKHLTNPTKNAALRTLNQKLNILSKKCINGIITQLAIFVNTLSVI